MSKPPRSRWSNFVHDLVTVDFHQADIYTGVRLAAIIVTVTVLGVITGHTTESSLATFGAAYVLAIDQIPSKGSRTRVLLTVSILYASIFSIGVIISIRDNLVVPLLALGLFIISYFTVYPRALTILMFASLVFVIGIATQGATLTLAGQDFLLFFAGGLWAIVCGMIFPARKTSKQQGPVTADPFQEQHQPKLTWQDKFRPLTSNLSIHSQHFQYAIVLAITSAVGMLITQWFELSERAWVLITVVVLLLPAYSEISFTFNKLVHRIIGTIIGALIAMIIIVNVQDLWLLSLFFFFFAIAFLSLIKMKNYAFVVIFMTVVILLLFDISEPTTASTTSLARIQNIFIGCVLSLLASSIWIAFWRKKSNLPLGHKRE